jgi:threonine dehydrogenase-like Zn-dependent dehydrogenase
MEAMPIRALTVSPGRPGSARLDELSDPPGEGALLVGGLAVGICGTDMEILAGAYGEAPAGRDRLVIGHESLGRVVAAPPDAGIAAGDLVVGIVRRPDPVPCSSCAVGEWDMCLNGRFTERGIGGRDGYAAAQFRLEPEFAVAVPPTLASVGMLIEPASVVAKAWEQIERIGRRARWSPARVLVTGAGPIGLLAALLGVQRGFRVTVLDRVTSGRKPELVRTLGARYHVGPVDEVSRGADVVIECTGVGQLVFDAIRHLAPTGIICLTGISTGARMLQVNGAMLNREIVLENNVIVGSVNANRRHYEAAVDALSAAEPAWLEGLVTRRVPLSRWQEVLMRHPDEVKTVLDLSA